MRRVHLTCDRCGAELVTEGYDWPSGWYHWRQQDLCHECAVPEIRRALAGCYDDADGFSDAPAPIGPAFPA